MRVEDLKLTRALRQARVLPSLCFAPVVMPDLLEHIRRDHFPGVTHALEFYFLRRGPLACIAIRPQHATVYVHEILNVTETPADVIAMICKHELLHLVIRPREVKRRMTSHPPEFLDREREIAPERDRVVDWLDLHVGTWLRSRPRLERVDVKHGWKARTLLKMTPQERRVWLESRRRESDCDL